MINYWRKSTTYIS